MQLGLETDASGIYNYNITQ